MNELEIIRPLGLIIGLSALLVLATQRLKIPSIILYIFAGLILGPFTGWVEVTETVDLISEVGIALLLFLVGLELNLDKIRDVGRVSMFAGLGQVAFTAAGGFGLALLLDLTVVEAVFVAVALTFSSTVVVVKLLEEKDDLDDLYGRISVGIFLVQDIVVIVALTFVSGLAGPETLSASAVAGSLALAFAGMGGLLAAALLTSRFGFPRAFHWISVLPEGLFIWSLLWCFLFVQAAELLEISVEIGAFLAGVSLAQLPYTKDLRRRVHPLVNFFILIFFVSLGLEMELEAAAEYWVEAVVLSVFVLLGKVVLFMAIISWLGYSEKTSFLSSVTVAQISEFSFIFAALGVDAGLIGEGIFSLIAVVGLVTISGSAYMIIYNRKFYEFCSRRRLLDVFAADQFAEQTDAGKLSDHVIVVGMNDMGRYIVEQLVARGETVLAVDTDQRKLNDLPSETLQGNASYTSVLEEANLPEAKLLVSALQIENTNKLLAYRCRQLGIPCSIHAFVRAAIPDLRALEVDYLIVSKEEGTKQFVEELRRTEVLPS